MAEFIKIFTDGSSSGNPGPGGFGIVMKYGDKVKEHSEGFRKTTNNRMELMAVIRGLEMLKTNKYPVHIYSDSKYVIDSITKGWVFGWVKKNFKDKKNPDLWKQYLKLHPQFKLTFHWVKGHAGHPENECCDQLAVEAGKGFDLKEDVGYEGN